MKGIILAGDSGRRLHPLTLGIPKHLLPVYDKPMIYYPIEMLVQAGITDILVVTTSGHQPLFRKAIGDSGFSGARFAYAVQEEAGGIAQAINIAAEFIGRDDACLITGDTVIDGSNVGRYLSKAVRTAGKSGNATIFVENRQYADQYGKVIMNRDLKPVEVVGDTDEQLYYSIASVYVFPNRVVGHARSVEPSERGRLEITDVCRRFFEERKLQVRVLDTDCIWFDTNTFDNILLCGEYMRQKKQRKHSTDLCNSNI